MLKNIDFAGNIGSIMNINTERVVTVKANVEDIPGPVARIAARTADRHQAGVL